MENLKFSITASAKLPIFDLSMISAKSSSIWAAMLSSFLIVALLFSPVSAYADFRSDSSYPSVSEVAVYSGLDLGAGAAIDGALGALGVQLALGAGASLTTKDLIESVISGTPAGVVGYEYQGKFYELADQSTIRIREDTVTIDGVDYKDVWLPHDAAVKFRVNAFDFISYYNLVSESSGTYASGVGTCRGIPIYQVGSTYQSPKFDVTSGGVVGEVTVTSRPYSSQGGYLYNANGGNCPYDLYAGRPVYFHIYGSSSSLKPYFYASRSASASYNDYGIPAGIGGTSFVSSPFEFNWTSSVLPSEPLPVDQGLRFRIPSSYVSGLPSVISPDLSQYSDFLNAIANAIEQSRLANVVDSTAFEEYDTPAPPVPSHGNIAEEPYASLDGSLSGIQDSLDNIDTNIGTVDESLNDIQIYAEDAADSLQSIDTNLSQSVADTAGIKGFVQQYLPGVHSLLSNISTSVSNIAGSVAAADETFFGNVVNSITVPFTPIFNIFKSGMGIWRYVVAWVGNISGPFTWSLSALSGAGSIFLSPIYAAAAAAVVLAVYKKFGR